MPLGSSTKSGKLIDRIINLLPADINIIKSNLFHVDYMPKQPEFDMLFSKWYWRCLPKSDDIIILLGDFVHKHFPFKTGKVIKIAHPASKRCHVDMDDYVFNTYNLIMSQLSDLH